MILRVFSWTAKKTNEWVLNKAAVNRELLDTVKARKLAYYGQISPRRIQQQQQQRTLSLAGNFHRPAGLGGICLSSRDTEMDCVCARITATL